MELLNSNKLINIQYICVKIIWMKRSGGGILHHCMFFFGTVGLKISTTDISITSRELILLLVMEYLNLDGSETLSETLRNFIYCKSVAF